MRYTTPLGDGTIVGIQASASLIEEAGWSAPIAVPGAISSVSADIDRAIDVLGIVGLRVLDGHLYAGAGIGHATGTISANICVEDDCGELSDSGDHTGFKAVVGFDSPLADSLNLITQIHYADYGDADYFGDPAELTSTGMIVGFLHRF